MFSLLIADDTTTTVQGKSMFLLENKAFTNVNVTGQSFSVNNFFVSPYSLFTMCCGLRRTIKQSAPSIKLGDVVINKSKAGDGNLKWKIQIYAMYKNILSDIFVIKNLKRYCTQYKYSYPVMHFSIPVII